ncbi:STAS domain-containing protein [Conexibacter sp. SYSU D00693]|uniref:STAS domain-containing protein n=1 Tax=Conexibacter sp. SYSU D00693 TaxID=2812560 RepID=UPI00196AF5C8|nr:STAS domain-containing protein [Conexibacter sp. SYSU D00693]
MHGHGGLEIREERGPEEVRLLVRGELDIASAPRLVTAALAAGGTRRHVVVDLSELAFSDTVGLNAVLRMRRRAAAAGITLEVVEPEVPFAALRVLRAARHLGVAPAAPPA